MARRRTVTRARATILEFPLLAGLVLLGCESTIPRVDPESPPFQGRSTAELAELELGRSSYIAKCSGCRALIRPARGDREYWKRWVEEMAERSHVTTDERERILKYLALACLPGQPQAPSRSILR